MDYLSLAVGVVLALVAIIFFISFLENRDSRNEPNARKVPPVPRPLPIIGNLFSLRGEVPLELAKLAKTYGPLMTLHLGQVPTVVVSSSVMARELLQRCDTSFSDRFLLDSLRAHDHHNNSVVWLPATPKWRNLRKIGNSHVFSMVRLDASQSLRKKKIGHLMSQVKKSSESGVAVNIGQAGFNTSLNVLSSTFFSMDLADSNSQVASKLKAALDGIMEELKKPNLADFFPALRKIDPQGIRRRSSVCWGNLIDLFNTMIKQRLQGKRPTGSSAIGTDVLDRLIGTSQGQSEDIKLSNIPHLLADLFAAGTDTTSRTVEWAMTELLCHPEKMRKAQTEIRKVVGKGKSVDESDMAQLSYLQAVVKETLRLYPAAPLMVPRKAKSDVKIFEFTVPKNTQVLVNVWAIARDPDVWENPNNFEPARFIGSEVDIKGHHFELIPFRAGRRICLGMSLAIRLVQLMLASLIHGFDWKLEGGISPEDLDSLGFTLQKDHQLHAIPVSV